MANKWFQLVSLSLCVLQLSACASSGFFGARADCVVPLTRDQIAKATASGDASNVWVREENAISIRVVASSDLNRIQRFPNGTAVGFYQMENPDAFVRDIATQTGLERLLLLNNMDSSILQYDVKSVQPNSSDRMDVARAERVRYIGVVVGYNDLITDRVVRLVQIPLVRTSRSKLNPINWILGSPAPRPAQLDILITLGSNRIDDVVINVRGECAKS